MAVVNISLITDYDAGVLEGTAVSSESVLRVFAQNTERLRDLLFAAIPEIGRSRRTTSARPRSRAPASGSSDTETPRRCGRGGLPGAGRSSEVRRRGAGTR